MTFAFTFATRKVFENGSSMPLICKHLIYLLYQAVLIFAVSKLLAVIDAAIAANITIGIIVRFSSVIAKIIITPITMTLNFFVMKGLVEKV